MKKMVDMIYLDIYLNGRFYCQLKCPYRLEFSSGVEIANVPDIREFVTSQRPSLNGKDFRVSFSNQKVFK